MADMKERFTREMSFEEEAKLFEEEARTEFAKETGCGDAEGVNNILRRGMRIIRKAREEIARQSLRPKGEWLGSGDGYDPDGNMVFDMWECSECFHFIDTDDPDTLPKFCPDCGADMRKGQDDETDHG